MIEGQLIATAQIIEQSSGSEEEILHTVGDAFLRAGVPVTRGRVEDDMVVFDVVVPRGQG